MSDNRRVYRTIRMAMKQLYPQKPMDKVCPNADNTGRAGQWDSAGQELSIAHDCPQSS